MSPSSRMGFSNISMIVSKKWVTASVASRALEMVSQHAEALMSLIAIVMPRLPHQLTHSRAHRRRRCRHQRHRPRQRKQVSLHPEVKDSVS